MKVLVTGNLGYIGSVLTEKLSRDGYDVIGLDIGYFKDNLVKESHQIKKQILMDLRDVSENEIEGVEAIIHLASLSNDARRI